MGSDQRIDDAKRALGGDAEEFDIEYEDKPEDSDSGKPQLVLYGEILEEKTIQKLAKAGFEFLFAQAEGEETDEDGDDEDEKETDEKDDAEATEVELEDEEYGNLEIVFEDLHARSGK